MTQTEEYKYTGEKPLNREPDIEHLLSSYITTKDPYDRNHGPVPVIDSDKHILHIDGAVKHPTTLSIAQLKNDYKQHTVLCALQCAGNRRHTMRTLIKEVDGIDWFDGAVMNCTWAGPRLRDILELAGIEDSLMPDDKGEYRGHAAFACYETPVQDDSWYGGSVELKRAMDADADAILALEMNGDPLTPEHGAPLRVIIPGVAGARSVKWLNRITLQLEDSKNFYQQRDYKVLPPEVTDAAKAKEYWHKVSPIMDMPVNSIVGIPESGSTVKVDGDGTIEVRGYALPHGSSGPVQKVEVSGDEGKTWINAELDFGEYGNIEDEASRRKVKWAWCLWRARINVEKGANKRVVSKATDFGGNTQNREAIWNLRGVNYNAWGEARDLIVV